MRVYKDTPFELTFMPWELEPPTTTLMVVVKATYALAHDGVCTIADEQVPCLGPVPWDDGDPPSLRLESDYAVLKPRGEWYVAGSAHAVGGPATVLPVRVKIGSSRKQIAVWGDRVWQRGMLGSKPSDPIPFESMPLRWERSFGGPSIAANPLGRGLGPMETEAGTVDPLPNIEDPSRPITSREDRPTPVGLFPIEGTWAARRAFTGTYDAVWEKSRWPYFPGDFDFRFFNCTLPDQQLPEGYWRGDEPIELQGLDRERATLKTRLPGLQARFFVEWATPRPPDATPLEMLTRPELEQLGPPELTEVTLKLDTVVIDSDAGHALCQWRGLVEVADAQFSNIARVFAIHEPLDTTEPHAHYERWLLAKLLEEADEFDPPEELADDFDDETAASTSTPEMDEPDLDVAMAAYETKMLAFLQSIETVLPEEPEPTPEEVRKKFADAGMEQEKIDEVLPLAEVEPPAELQEPASYRRLAALMRRRHGTPFREMDLSEGPFHGLDLSGVDFSGSILTDVSFEGANISNCKFDGALLIRANLSRADARGASFVGADLTEMRADTTWLDGAILDEAAGTGAVFTSSRFRAASLKDADLEECDFSRCDLQQANLDGADLVGSTLDEADFSTCSMNDTSLESVHAHSVRFDRSSMHDLRGSDGADFTGSQLVLVDAARAQLQDATLVGVNFSGSNLVEADLSGANAERINLMRCVLRAAKLDRANLQEAVLIQSDLFEASLESANLSGADARGAHLHTAHLWRARLDGTILEGAVLERTVVGDESSET